MKTKDDDTTSRMKLNIEKVDGGYIVDEGRGQYTTSHTFQNRQEVITAVEKYIEKYLE